MKQQDITYKKATLEDADRICFVVKHTKAVIYPDYYSMVYENMRKSIQDE